MKNARISLVAAALTLPVIGLPAVSQAASPATVKNIVIVHGALADGSGWKSVYDILTRDGFKVSIVQDPQTTLADDVAATQRIIDEQDGPSILVGHSYGG